jgi:thiol-disulfide isomerase/thioredoxin
MKRRDWMLAGLGATLGGLAWSEPAAIGSVVSWPTLQLLDGSTWQASSWQGQPAIVVFWATYCPFCKRHNAHLEKLFRETQGRGLRLLGVALDGDEAAVRKYMAQNQYQFPVALDRGELRPRVTARRVIPMTGTFDAQGHLLQAIPGEMFEEDLMDLAQSLRKRAA